MHFAWRLFGILHHPAGSRASYRYVEPPVVVHSYISITNYHAETEEHHAYAQAKRDMADKKRREEEKMLKREQKRLKEEEKARLREGRSLKWSKKSGCLS